MSEYREMSGVDMEEQDEVDLKELLYDVGWGLKKFWWLILGMALIFALLSAGLRAVSYTPNYVASATMSVKERGNISYEMTKSAEKMEMVFPYILTSGVLKNVVAEDMGLSKMPGEVRVSVEEGANIFTVYASAEEPQLAYDLLQSVIEHYPEVSEFVLGQISLEILDESGVPTDSGKDAAVKDAMIKGALIGLLLGLLPVGICIWTRRTVKSKKELKKSLNLSELGSIPAVKEKKRRKEKFFSLPSLMNERVPHAYQEAVSRFCIRVMREMEQKGYKTILMTSSVAGEGKTTLAVNLAISLAKSGKKVILADCDMRNPSVASVMNESEKHPGIGAVLQKKTDLEKALKTVSFPGGKMKVLFGGVPGDKDTKLLGSKEMKRLVEALSEEADFVIFDAAPSGIFVDASALAKYVDAAIYVVRYDYVNMRQIQSGMRELDMSGVDMIGYVFNNENDSRKGYGYGYGYYGGYGYYPEKNGGGAERKASDRSGRHLKD